MNSPIRDEQFKRVSRRELLKLAPVLALGAFAIPELQKPLLKAGLGFSDWVSAKMFRTGHLAPTFADTELTPFDTFPINGYDVADPGVDFDKWNLSVSGAVQKPGNYLLAQIQSSLPKFSQNTRHVCVERLGCNRQLWWGASLRFLEDDWCRYDSPLRLRRVRGRLLRDSRYGDGSASADDVVF